MHLHIEITPFLMYYNINERNKKTESEENEMKNLSECKEYYKDLYMDCLENDSFEKNIFESTEKARYETFCETLKFIYGADFENIMPNWSNDALKEFYSRK